MQRKICVGTILTVVIFIVGACASVTVRKIPYVINSDGEKVVKSDLSGVRFYRPAPYLWITLLPPSEKVNIETVVDTKRTTVTSTDTLERFSFEIVWLPDYSEEYIMQWSSILGTVKPSITLADGWNMTGFGAEVNSQADKNLTAIASLATSIVALEALVEKTLKPGLYPIKYVEGKLEVEFDKPVLLIK